MIFIKNKYLKVAIFTFILFLCVGAVCAHENDTVNVNDELSVDDNLKSDNIKELIDDCKDNGVVNLDEKTYCIDNETHVILNKSVTLEGVKDKTVIDGKNNTLFFEVEEIKIEEPQDGPIVIGWTIDGYVLKQQGKNMTFKNIEFRDLNMITWHEMTFENCSFLNTNFSSYEYPNTFKNCRFEKSIMEIILFYGYDPDLYHDYTKIISCNFTDSAITNFGVYTTSYIPIAGGTPFRITNRLDLINSNLCNSNISLSQNNVTLTNSSFSNTGITGSSNIFSIEDSQFVNPQIEMGFSIISLNKSSLENPIFKLHAGYFSRGCELNVKNTSINNCSMENTITFGSRIGSLKIKNSQITNSSFNLTYTDALLNGSQFNNTVFELFFCDADILNSTFVNDANITDTIKTRKYKEVYTTQDGEIFTPSLKECQVKTDYNVENSYLINGSGKYEINASDINMDTTHKITVINENDPHYFNGKLIIKVEDYLGNPVSGLEINIDYVTEYIYPIPSAKTDSNGIAKYTLNKLGNVSLRIYYETDGVLYSDTQYGKEVNVTVKPTVTGLKVTKVKFNKNSYSNIKGYLKIKTTANSSSDLKNLKFAYKVYTNGKSKTYYSKTNAKGETAFKLPKTLSAGRHKIEIMLVNTNIKKTVTVKVAKAKTAVKAPKVTGKFKKSKHFKITVKNKATKKPASKVKVKIKVYTGKKYKTYTVKTNKKGTAQINIKKLKVGKHKVVISSANGNYKISAKSLITIN